MNWHFFLSLVGIEEVLEPGKEKLKATISMLDDTHQILSYNLQDTKQLSRI